MAVRCSAQPQGNGGFSMLEKPPLFVFYAKRYFVTRTSTRRFFARPASVVFGASGLVSA